ncbi:hypothetical protein [Actinotalea sp. C106]|uniref:hypothetical protein n=1 Tax=Actinotalea sp. C106 TaxID=2908644 RepID=UPI002027DFDB|nr:hypothetical protein [Actinotalea sp. C106]
MDTRKRRRATAVLGAVALLGTAGCAAEKNIDVTNASDVTVTVRFGEEDLGEVTADGGVALLGTTECYEGPIVVKYTGGRVLELEGPICPEQTLAVDDETIRIVEATSSD